MQNHLKLARSLELTRKDLLKSQAEKLNFAHASVLETQLEEFNVKTKALQDAHEVQINAIKNVFEEQIQQLTLQNNTLV